MKTFFKHTIAVAKDAFAGMSEHEIARKGAALAYYTVFSIGPLLLIAIAVAGLIFGRDAAQNEVYETLKGLLGSSGADIVQQAVEGAAKKGSSVIATIVGVVVLVFTASGVFGELHTALNDMWNVEVKKVGIWTTIRERFFSLTMVFGVAFLLLVSLVITAALGVVGRWLEHTLPGGATLWQIINTGISLAIIGLLFALLFKYVPDIKIRWRDVLIAGAVTSVLFTVGKLALGIYITQGDVGSSYGAASSLIVLLVWVYYSSQIVYFGAEISRAIANVSGTHVRPARIAAKVSPEVEKKDEDKPKQHKPGYLGPHPPWPKPS